MTAITVKAVFAPASIREPDVGRLRRTFQKAGAALWQALRPIIRIMAKALMQHKIRRATLELSRLDDRLLKDIGLSRWGLEDAVRSNRVGLIPLGSEWSWMTGCSGDCDGCPDRQSRVR